MRYSLVFVSLLIACKSKSEPPPPAPAPAPRPAEHDPTKWPDTCFVKASGGVTADVKMKTGPYVDAKQWSKDDVGLKFKCGAEHSELSVETKPGVDVPFGPKVYKAEDLAVSGRIDDRLLQDFTGTLEVKTFDNKQIAGTFALTAKRTSGNDTVTLEGTFQIPCPPDFPNCAK